MEGGKLDTFVINAEVIPNVEINIYAGYDENSTSWHYERPKITPFSVEAYEKLKNADMDAEIFDGLLEFTYFDANQPKVRLQSTGQYIV